MPPGDDPGNKVTHMNIKTLAAIAAIAMLSLSATAATNFVPVTQTYEVAIGDFQAPISTNAMAIFKPCDKCDSMSLRVTPNTQYIVNGKSVTLQKFRDAISLADRRALIPVNVKEHLESKTVVSIKVTL
jgi:hypothetical protein